MSVDVYEWLAARVRERRAELRLTQAQLASLAGLSRSALANIETGRQAVLLHDFLALARCLEIGPEALLPPPAVGVGETRNELPRSVRLFVESVTPKASRSGRRP